MDNSPTSLFESYESDFKQIIISIRAKLDTDVPGQKGEQRKATLRRVGMEIDEAEEMVSQMEVEIQGMPQSIKSQYQSRVRTSKSDLTRLKTQAKDLHAATTRAELLESSSTFRTSSPDTFSVDGSQRTRLLAGTQTLADGTRRLEDSHRIALETEDLGADILNNLQSQRETILRTREGLQTADTNIDRASGTLKGMIRRMNQQRIVTGAIIIVLVLLILLILWEKLT